MPSSDELKAKGNTALQDNDIEGAISAYSEAIAIDDKNHVLYSNRSAAYAQSEDYESALKDAEMCISIKPDWVKGYTRKATALEFLDRYKDAEAILKEAIKLDPESASLKSSLSQVKKGLVFESTKEQVAQNPKIAHYLKDPIYVKNLKSFFSNPQNIGMMLGDEKIKETFEQLYMNDLNMDTTPEYTKKEVPKKEETPAKPEMTEEQQKALEQKVLGNAAYKNKDFQTALKHYDLAIEADPTTLTYYSNKSAVYFEMPDYDKCIEQSQQAVEVGRDNRADYKLIAKLFARIGQCYEKKEDVTNASKFYEKSLSEYRSPDVIKKSQALKKLLQENAREAYISPEIAEAEKTKGNTFFSAGNYPDAMKHYTEAIKRNPTDAKLYSNRAACYSKLMEFPSALSDCDKCIDLDPTFIKGYLRKGTCLLAMRDIYQAKKVYSKALELDPECSEAKEGLRQTYGSDLDPEKARQQALNDPEIAEILSDPAMRMILNQMEDPKAVKEHLSNPEIASKFAKLVEAGLVSIR